MKENDKIAILGTNGLPASYGGFETLTHHLVGHLNQEFDLIVYCSKTPKNKQIKLFNGAKLIYFPFKANGWQSIIYDILTIIHAWFTVDKLLILGTSGSVIFPFKILFKKKIVLNIGGIDWNRSKWGYLTQKYIQLSERICVKFSDVVITDNLHIQKLYKKFYNVDSVLIEYGGDQVLKPTPSKEDFAKYPFLSKKYYMNVARAQSDNNIHLVLSAFESTPNGILVLVSNWNSSKYGKDLWDKYHKKYKNIFLIPAIYEQEKLDVLRSNCYVYIHSHSFCGTAPSLVEAMNLSLPVICYNAQTNIETTENKTMYFKDEDELLKIVQKMTEDEALFLSKISLGNISTKSTEPCVEFTKCFKIAHPAKKQNLAKSTQ